MSDYASVHRPRLELVHSRRRDDPPPASVLARGLFFVGLWLVALCAPWAFAISMFAMQRVAG